MSRKCRDPFKITTADRYHRLGQLRRLRLQLERKRWMQLNDVDAKISAMMVLLPPYPTKAKLRAALRRVW